MKKLSSTALSQELQDLQVYLRSEAPSRLLTAERLESLALRLATGEEPGTSDEDAGQAPDERELALEILDKEMTPVGKRRRMWWMEGAHNFMLNQTLMGTVNPWIFSILPMQGAKGGYRAATSSTPEGIVLKPLWIPFKNDSYPLTPKVAELFVKMGKAHVSLKAFASKQLDDIEKAHHIQIPNDLRTKILSGIEKVAKRRVEVDRLKVKDELWPLDGGKPIALSAWG